MFSVSETIDGKTYTISGSDLRQFLDHYAEVEGPYGLAKRVETVALEVGAEAVKPIAATDQANEPEAEPAKYDELVDLIRNAPDRNALVALWRAHKAKWDTTAFNGKTFNDLAVERGKQLDKMTKEGSK